MSSARPTPITSREAVLAAAAILRKGQCPPKYIATPIIDRLEAIALALKQANGPETSDLTDHETKRETVG